MRQASKKLLLALSLTVLWSGAGHSQSTGASAPALDKLKLEGKPVAEQLPPWCNHGECSIYAIEVASPVLFSSAGVLFQVLNRTINYEMRAPKKRRAGPQYVQHVFCSKTSPAVIEPDGDGKFTLTYLDVSNEGSYGHADAIRMNVYFAICHQRKFNASLDGAASFARSLNYKTVSSGDQVIIDKPEDIVQRLQKP